MSDKLEKKLREGIAQLDLNIEEAAIGQLLRYLAGLIKWNQAYNLTAVRDPEQMVVKHLLDSLTVLPFVHGESLIDVGTGGGLPGMVLAIIKPGLAVTLLDSNSKKTRFLKQIAAELGLKNVSVVHSRAEEFQGQFDLVASRAFATLADMLHWCAHMAKPTGQFLAMKGQLPSDEITAMPAGFVVQAVESLRVPFLNEERHLVLIRKDI